MSNRGLYQSGLVFAILTAVAWFLFVAGLLMPASGPDMGIIETYLAGARSLGTLLYLWGGILGSLCIVPVYLALCLGYWRETGSVLLAPIGLALVGVVFLAMGFMVDAGSAVYTFAPALAQADQPSGEAMLVAAQLAQDSIEMTWAMGSFLAYGGPMVWIAILLFRAGRVPSWLNWTGIIAGLAGFVWIVSWLPIPPIGPIPLLVNIVLGMVWFIGLSLILVRSSDDDSTDIAPEQTKV